jgi:hypothetical protein
MHVDLAMRVLALVVRFGMLAFVFMRLGMPAFVVIGMGMLGVFLVRLGVLVSVIMLLPHAAFTRRKEGQARRLPQRTTLALPERAWSGLIKKVSIVSPIQNTTSACSRARAWDGRRL